MRQRFEQNLRSAGLLDWVTVHQMTASEAAACWRKPIDLLLWTATNRRRGPTKAYVQWAHLLKPDGMLVIGASSDGPNEPTRWFMRVIRAHLHAPEYRAVQRVAGITLAIRDTGDRSRGAEPIRSRRER